MQQKKCYCGSAADYADCCEIVHKDPTAARTAEMLMRARYAAFSTMNIDFIYNTTAPSSRRYQSKAAILAWARACKWMQLEIIRTSPQQVEFKAYYLDENMQPQTHHEKSTFLQLNGTWYFSL